MPISDQFLDVCTKCKALCCTFVLPPVTEEERNQILKAGFEDHFNKVDDAIYKITPSEKGNSPYLQSDLSCKIHQVKPNLCKIWPVVPRYHNNTRGGIIVKCPLYSQLSEEDIQKAKKEAEQIPIPILLQLWKISEDTKEKYKIFEYVDF